MSESPSAAEALHRPVERLKGHHGRLDFCQEAGPCGDGVHRLSGLGQDCLVVALSRIPSRPMMSKKATRCTPTAAMPPRLPGCIGQAS